MKKEIVTITCDYNGCFAPDSTNVRFSAFGGDYTIDLCELHHATLVELIRPYAESGQKVKRVNMHITPKVKAKMPPKEMAAEPTKAVKRSHRKTKETEAVTE